MKLQKKYFIVEGDLGGQIYFTVDQDLTTLDKVIKAAQYIDKLGFNDPSSLAVTEEILIHNSLVLGGKGGGLAQEGKIWVHGDFGPEVYSVVYNILMS